MAPTGLRRTEEWRVVKPSSEDGLISAPQASSSRTISNVTEGDERAEPLLPTPVHVFCKGANCEFRHTEGDGTAVRPLWPTPVISPQQNSSGLGRIFQQQFNSGGRTQPCLYFKRGAGFCRNGAGCQFLHEGGNERPGYGTPAPVQGQPQRNSAASGDRSNQSRSGTGQNETTPTDGARFPTPRYPQQGQSVQGEKCSLVYVRKGASTIPKHDHAEDEQPVTQRSMTSQPEQTESYARRTGSHPEHTASYSGPQHSASFSGLTALASQGNRNVGCRNFQQGGCRQHLEENCGFLHEGGEGSGGHKTEQRVARRLDFGPAGTQGFGGTSSSGNLEDPNRKHKGELVCPNLDNVFVQALLKDTRIDRDLNSMVNKPTSTFLFEAPLLPAPTTQTMETGGQCIANGTKLNCDEDSRTGAGTLVESSVLPGLANYRQYEADAVTLQSSDGSEEEDHIVWRPRNGN